MEEVTQQQPGSENKCSFDVEGYSVHEIDEATLEAFRYVESIPGKNVRGKLIDAFQFWLQIPPEKVHPIKEVISNLHNASLLIDDIEDNSKLRRGVPVAHKIYGVPTTLNTANYVYFLALEKCLLLQNANAMKVFTSELLNLHRGQAHDILWRDSGQCPSEDEYKAMVLDKTGGLFRLAVGLMQACSDDQTDFSPLLNELALYFQIRDDYVNISSAWYSKTKGFCEDITEGKFSFPILHSINSNPNDHRLINILKQRTEDEDVKKYAVEWMEQTGSLTYTREVINHHKDRVLDEISKLGGHPVLSKIIIDLDKQLDDRRPSNDEDPEEKPKLDTL